MKKLIFVIVIGFTACTWNSNETNVNVVVNDTMSVDSMDLMDSIGIEQVKRLDSIYKEY
jgi:hypothetical protein